MSKVPVVLSLLLPLVSPATEAPWLDAFDTAIAKYQSVVSHGGWETLDGDGLLKEDATGKQVQQLVARLRVTGDLQAEPTTYNSQVTEAVKTFQRRHGLKVDGVVGPNTRAALNVPAKVRLAHLKRTRAAMSGLKLADAGPAVIVNVPEFRLRAIKEDEVILDSRVVVGEPGWETPTMSDAIETIVFQPRWNIPWEIVVADLAPKVAKDPSYLERNNMTVLKNGFNGEETIDPATIDWSSLSESDMSFFVRQESGPENPLGQIKFLFPNSEDVYLHDTPDKYLFDRPQRAVSHGCIRVEKPFALAEHLLGADKVAEARNKKEREFVSVPKPAPVHLVYWTSWIDADGTIHFREDIYDKLADVTTDSSSSTTSNSKTSS